MKRPILHLLTIMFLLAVFGGWLYMALRHVEKAQSERSPLLNLMEQQRLLIEAQRVQLAEYERLIAAQETNIAIRARIMEHLEKAAR